MDIFWSWELSRDDFSLWIISFAVGSLTYDWTKWHVLPYLKRTNDSSRVTFSGGDFQRSSGILSCTISKGQFIFRILEIFLIFSTVILVTKQDESWIPVCSLCLNVSLLSGCCILLWVEFFQKNSLVPPVVKSLLSTLGKTGVLIH